MKKFWLLWCFCLMAGLVSCSSDSTSETKEENLPDYVGKWQSVLREIAVVKLDFVGNGKTEIIPDREYSELALQLNRDGTCIYQSKSWNYEINNSTLEMKSEKIVGTHPSGGVIVETSIKAFNIVELAPMQMKLMETDFFEQESGCLKYYVYTMKKQ